MSCAGRNATAVGTVLAFRLAGCLLRIINNHAFNVFTHLLFIFSLEPLKGLLWLAQRARGELFTNP